MSLARWLVLLFSVVMIAIILSTGMIYYLSWQKDGELRRRSWANYAQSQARQLQTRTRDLQRLLQGLAGDRQVVEASQLGGAPLQAEEARLQRIIPHALRVRIFPPGVEAERPSMSFADLDLIQRARRQMPAPSVHGGGPSRRYLAVAHAIESEGRLTGVLWVKVDLKWLEEAMPVPDEGAMALMQGKLTLLYRGKPGFKEKGEGAEIPIEGTMWRLRYWIPSTAWEEYLGRVTPALFAMFLIMGSFFLFVRWLKAALQHDASLLFTLVNDLIDGTFRGSHTFKLRELQSLADKLLMTAEKNRFLRPLDKRKARSQPEVPVPAEGDGQASEPLVSMSASREEAEPAKPPASVSLPDSIFRPCDIRGEAGETLTPEIARELGRAIGSEVQAQGEQVVVVGCDSRPSSEPLKQALIEGIQVTGRDVVDLGTVPVPILYFANHYLTHHSGVMVTGSSSPAEFNGLKITINGRHCSGDALLGLRERCRRNEISQGMGMLESQDLLADYVGHIIDDVQIGRPVKVIVDSGSDVVAESAVALLRTLGCEVDALHTEGLLDPTDPERLKRLMAKVQKDEEAELGLAFDGDGDRLTVVDGKGRWIPPDLVLMLLAADALSRQPGADIVFDLECSRHLAGYIVQQGGHPVQVAPGYCSLLNRMEEKNGAVMAGGFGGHVIFKERWFGTVDALYAAARLIEVLSAEPSSPDEIFAELPQSPSTPRLLVTLPDEEVDRTMRLLEACADKFFNDAKINLSHGIRVDFANGWGSVRGSSSLPALVFRFEADDRQALLQIRDRFQQWFDTIELPVSVPSITGDHNE